MTTSERLARMERALAHVHNLYDYVDCIHNDMLGGHASAVREADWAGGYDVAIRETTGYIGPACLTTASVREGAHRTYGNPGTPSGDTAAPDRHGDGQSAGDCAPGDHVYCPDGSCGSVHSVLRTAAGASARVDKHDRYHRPTGFMEEHPAAS